MSWTATPTWSSVSTSSARSTCNPPRPPVDTDQRWWPHTTASAPGDLHAPARSAPPPGRPRPVTRQALWAHQAAQAPRRVPGLCALPTLAVPTRRADLAGADNYSPHLPTRDDARIGQWAAAYNVELAYTPTNASWLNRIAAQFTALHYFALDGTDHASHHEQASMIRRYIAWRNRNAHDRRLGESSTGQTLPDAALGRRRRRLADMLDT
jgi:hypothetical protein